MELHICEREWWRLGRSVPSISVSRFFFFNDLVFGHAAQLISGPRTKKLTKTSGGPDFGMFGLGGLDLVTSLAKPLIVVYVTPKGLAWCSMRGT